MIGLAWKHDNVYIDASAYAPHLRLAQCAAEVGALGLPRGVEENSSEVVAERFGL